jgi:hypothetical protein
VVASSVSFYVATPERAVLDITGTVKSVDAVNHTIRVQTHDGRTLDLTLAPDIPLPTRGETVHAAGYWNGGRLQVREFGH